MSPNSFYSDFDTATWPEPRHPSESDHRTAFQVDRDRVVFSYPFRRLQSKTQVFQFGEYDFYRTRLTHSIEVARIGRSICEYLRERDPALAPDFFVDADLVEAVGLAHDLGHPPFGHVGERKLNALMAPYGGFEGNAQTLRLLCNALYDRADGPRGMSPTRAFADGVLKYKRLYSEAHDARGAPPANHFLYDDQAPVRAFVTGDGRTALDPACEAAREKSIECQIMDWADDAAYCLHDVLDGFKAGFLTPDRVERWASSQKLDDEETALVRKLIDRIHAGTAEPAFASKVGDFIRACRLKRKEHPLGTLTARVRPRCGGPRREGMPPV